MEIDIKVPNFVPNNDVYKALDEAQESLEKRHVEVQEIAVNGLMLPPEMEDSTDG